MLEDRKAKLRQSIAHLQTYISAAERQDSNQRKLQLFGGSVDKEKEFYNNLKATKEKFARTYYNITKQKEKVLFNNKLNKLVALIRKVDKEDAVDELVYEIDQELVERVENVRDKMRFVRRVAHPGLNDEIQKIYKELEVKEHLEASRPLIRRHIN